MKHSLQLKLGQHLTLTPQLQQSIRLLQLSTLELNQELEQMLQDNPLLEREEEDDSGLAAAEPPRTPQKPKHRAPTPRRRKVLTAPTPKRPPRWMTPTGTITARQAGMTTTRIQRKARFQVPACANTC